MIDDYEDDEALEDDLDDEEIDDSEPYKAPPTSAGVKTLIGCLIAFVCITILVALAAALVVPALLQGRGEAWKIQCTNNLKQIYPAAAAYANRKYAFPKDNVDDPTAHDSLNILLRSEQGKHLDPKLFKCPAGLAVPAEVDENGRFQLDEDTNDYAWAVVRSRPPLAGKPMPLASDKYYDEYDDEHHGHEGIIHVLFTDGSVETWDIDDPAVQEKMDMDTGLPIGLGR